MYTFESRIRYSETDSRGKLTMASLINYFQDSSTFQSEDLGLGVEYMREQHLVWVLSAWQIAVCRYPSLCERVTIGTRPYDMRGFVGYRNFAMLDERGGYVAKANSLWSLLNVDTGKPVAVPEEMLAGYRLGERLDMEYAPRKIGFPEGGEAREPVTVRKHHLDTNHHVNNQQFISMAMDCLPEDFEVGQVRAEYKKQAFLGDVLVPRVAGERDRIMVSLEDAQGKSFAVTEFLRMSSMEAAGM